MQIFKKKVHVLLFDVAFALAAPIGTAIGIAIQRAVQRDQFTYSITDGTFQALSGGILIYVGLVHMLKEELERKELERKDLRVAIFLGFLLGAATMAIIGIWA